KELYRLVARLFARPAYDVSLREVEQLLNEIYEYNPEKPDEFYGLRNLESLYNQKLNGRSTQACNCNDCRYQRSVQQYNWKDYRNQRSPQQYGWGDYRNQRSPQQYGWR